MLPSVPSSVASRHSGCWNSRDFKIRYGELLLRVLWPRGTRLTTPFSPQNSNRFRFRCTATGRSASTCLYKMDTFDFILLSYDMGLINDDDFLLLCPFYISQNIDLPVNELFLEPPVIPATKQNNTDKMFDFSTGRVFA